MMYKPIGEYTEEELANARVHTINNLIAIGIEMLRRDKPEAKEFTYLSVSAKDRESGTNYHVAVMHVGGPKLKIGDGQ